MSAKVASSPSSSSSSSSGASVAGSISDLTSAPAISSLTPSPPPSSSFAAASSISRYRRRSSSIGTSASAFRSAISSSASSSSPAARARRSSSSSVASSSSSSSSLASARYSSASASSSPSPLTIAVLSLWPLSGASLVGGAGRRFGGAFAFAFAFAFAASASASPPSFVASIVEYLSVCCIMKSRCLSMTSLRLESIALWALNRTTFSILIQNCITSLATRLAFFLAAAASSSRRLITLDSRSRFDRATACAAFFASFIRNFLSRTKSPASHFISSRRWSQCVLFLEGSGNDGIGFVRGGRVTMSYDRSSTSSS